MSIGNLVLTIVFLGIMTFLGWLWFRSQHGFASLQQFRGILRVFRNLNSAKKLLIRAEKLCQKGDVSRLITERETALGDAATLTQSLDCPALSVDPKVHCDRADRALKSGYRAEAGRFIRRITSMKKQMDSLAASAKSFMTLAGLTEKDFEKELDGTPLS